MKIELVGIIGDVLVTRFIENYNPQVPEQLLTAKKSISEEFRKKGYNPLKIEFYANPI